MNGVRQGCVAVPHLFNCTINHLTQVCQQISRVQLGSYYLTDLEYVDNTTLFSNMATAFEAGLIVFKEEASKVVLEVTWGKSKVMYIGDGPDPQPITISSEVVKFTSSNNYLDPLS